MSSDNVPKSERFQTLTAVLFLSIIAAIFLLILARDNISGAICNYAGNFAPLSGMCSDMPGVPSPLDSGQVVASRITSACLDSDGLKISVAFDQPLTGSSTIQVFTTGDDYFPSEQGISDSFRMNLAMPSAADHLDITIPVDSMPVGEQIFGNITTFDEAVTSFVAYSLNVADCSTTSALPDLILSDIPSINSATCLPSRQLMISFRLEGSVLGQYRVLVNDTPYQLASVINQPATLFFSGEPPPEEPVVIRLMSATDDSTVFEETYTPPACGGT